MKLALLAALACTAVSPAVASDADCVRARDQHTDFKAILDNDPKGRAQFETVEHGNDGIVTITRWVNGEKRVIRKTLHGVFGRVVETVFGTQTQELAFSPSIDPAKLFPLHPGQSADYRVSIGRADRFDPKFADVKVVVGAQRDVSIGGCKLQTLEIVIDWRGTGPEAPLSKSTIVYSPALDYPVAFTSRITVREKTIDNTTKVNAVEAWSK